MEKSRWMVPGAILYPDDLPIAQRRDEILATIRDNQVVVIAGETGSGKSTQLPKFCLELGRGTDGWIGHTQPRRIAARAVAERVAEELKVELGQDVGYAVRFTDKVSPKTMVKVMTDGILLAEVQRDRMLRRYDTIIIDEAHERSLNIDFLLGYLRQLLPRRPDLKLIITSATIDTARFSEHFDDAPIVEVSGRAYPVELRYRPLEDPSNPDGQKRDQPEAICDAVKELFAEPDGGDVLVFCSGEREIRDAVEAVDELELHNTETIPLYARLTASEQHRVFAAHKKRRVVIATNVAETSLTVPGIRYVVDAGLARISRFSRRTKVQRLPIEPVSQASANQRSGRCGRLGPGIAIRLYSEDDYNDRPDFTDPEIQRTNLASVILQMAALGLGNIEAFPFVDPPDSRAIRDGVTLLEELGAVDPEHADTKKWLTPLGRQLAKVPLDPRLGRMLLAAADNGCLREVTTIAAGLSIQDPRERPSEKRDAANQFHQRYDHPKSDFMSLLNLWDYLDEQRRAGSSGKFRRMCGKEFLNYNRVREWQDIRAQLRRVAKELKLTTNSEASTEDNIHRSLLTGLLSHVGTKDRDSFEYRGARNTRFAIAPGSMLFKKKPQWVMASELVETNRMWARGVAPINLDWLEDLGDHLIKRSYSDPWWDVKRGAAVAHESATLFGLPIAANRIVLWSHVDAADARDLFIHHALVEGEWESNHSFITHNNEQRAEAEALETRLRRSDLTIGPAELFDWFDQRVPDSAASTAHFNNWWKRRRKREPELLNLTLDDLLRVETDDLNHAEFPESWSYGDITLGLAYDNDPTTSWDGLTVDIPIGVLNRIEASTFDWQVPGFRRDLVEALIRSMPKALRKRFVPVPETVEAVFDKLDPADGSLHDVLRTELARHANVAIPPDAFNNDKIPNHLRASYRIIDDQDAVMAEGTNLEALKDLVRDHVRESLASTHHELEVVGLTQWSIGELPRVVETTGPGHTVLAYPALIDEGETVAVRLLATADEQADAMWAGTRRLLLLNRPSVSKPLRALLTNDVKLALVNGPYPSPSGWFDDVMNASVDQLMLDKGAPAWTATEFDALLAHVRDRLPNTVGEIGRASAAVLTDLRTVEGQLAALPQKFSITATDVRHQIDRLIYPGFLTGLGGDRLADLRRYVQAIEWRLAQVVENPRRDQEVITIVRPLENEFDQLAAVVPWSPELEDTMWMLQELRVSLFAQSIGAKGATSPKRIRRALTAMADPR